MFSDRSARSVKLRRVTSGGRCICVSVWLTYQVSAAKAEPERGPAVCLQTVVGQPYDRRWIQRYEPGVALADLFAIAVRYWGRAQASSQQPRKRFIVGARPSAS